MLKLSRIDKIAINKLLYEQWLSKINSVSTFVRSQLDLQKSNLFLWIPVIFSCGIGAYFALPVEPPLFLGLFSLALMMAVYSILSTLRPMILVFIIFAAGFSATTLRTHSVSTPILSKKMTATEVTGRIREIEKLHEGKGSRMIIDVIDIEKLQKNEQPLRLRLTIRKDENVRVGQTVRLLAGLNPPSAPLIPGGFDFRRYLFFQKIGAVGFVYNEPEVITDKTPSGFFVKNSGGRLIESLRQIVELRIYEIIPPDRATIAAALMVGKKNAISEKDRQAIRDAGLAHMLAISGLHVGIFAGTLFFVLRFIMACIPSLALRYPIKKIAAVFAVAGAVFYMFMAGTTVPTQRSVLMITIVFLAIIVDRSPISLRLVAASAIFVLIIKPESLLSVSFQMSFAAVTSLVYFYDVTRQKWSNAYSKASITKKASLYFIGVCLTTIIASIATAPFSLYHFGQVSFIGSASNLLAMPLFAFFIMPLALLSIVLMPLGLDAFPLTLMGYGIEGMLDISYWAASLPHAVIYNAMWPFSAFILINGAVLFMMLWKGAGKYLAIPALIYGIVLTQKLIMPDVLVAGSHKLFLFRQSTPEEGIKLFTSSRRNDRFVLENWEKLYGKPVKSALLLDYKGTGKDDNTLYKCGEQGCRFTIQGQKVSFARSAYILKEECTWADLLISEEPVPYGLQCRASYIIDKFDTWKNGTHAVWLSPEIRIKTIADSQGNRLWSKPDRKSNDKSVKD